MPKVKTAEIMREDDFIDLTGMYGYISVLSQFSDK